MATTCTSKDQAFTRDQLYWLDQGDEKVLLLPRILNEEFQFPKDEPKLSQRVVLDCKEVQHVSSAWASKFINWHRTLDPKLQFVFRNSSRKMIDMMNFMIGFLPKDCIVESFEAPFECPSCGHEQSELMTRGKHYLEGSEQTAPILRIPFELNCDKCPGMMEFSVLENIYLRFLNSKHES